MDSSRFSIVVKCFQLSPCSVLVKSRTLVKAWTFEGGGLETHHWLDLIENIYCPYQSLDYCSGWLSTPFFLLFSSFFPVFLDSPMREWNKGDD